MFSTQDSQGWTDNTQVFLLKHFIQCAQINYYHRPVRGVTPFSEFATVIFYPEHFCTSSIMANETARVKKTSWTAELFVQEDPELWKLVGEKQWLKFLSRIESFPEETKYATANGWNIMHRACYYDPTPSVVINILRAYPEVTMGVCRPNGRLPLHEAVSTTESSIDVVRILLLHYPEAASCTDSYGQTPLTILSRKYCDGRGICFNLPASNQYFDWEEESIHLLWAKVKLVAEAAFFGSLRKDKRTSEKLALHALLGCTSQLVDIGLIELCMKLQPKQIQQRLLNTKSSGDCYPLHTCCASGIAMNGESSLIRLCQLYPEAATSKALPHLNNQHSRRDRENLTTLYPLHLALSNTSSLFYIRSKNGSYENPIFILAMANPSALGIIEPSTKLFPFMLAGLAPCEKFGHLSCRQSGYLNSPQKEWELVQLSTVFTLLRMCPENERFYFKKFP